MTGEGDNMPFEMTPLGMLASSIKELKEEIVKQRSYAEALSGELHVNRIEMERLRGSIRELSEQVSNQKNEAEWRDTQYTSIHERVMKLEQFKVRIIAYVTAAFFVAEMAIRAWDTFKSGTGG